MFTKNVYLTQFFFRLENQLTLYKVTILPIAIWP